MKLERQLRLLDAHLRIAEATQDAMQIAAETDDEEEVSTSSLIYPPARSSTVVINEDQIPPEMKPSAPSRRPTREFRALSRESYLENLEQMLTRTPTLEQRELVREAVTRGISLRFISHEEAEAILMRLERP